MHVMKTHIELCNHHFHRQNAICTRALAFTAFTPGIQGTLNDFFCVCLNVKWKMLLYYAAVLFLILAEVRCCLKTKTELLFSVFYHFIQLRCAKLLFHTTSGHDCSACFTEGCGTFLSSTVTHHLSGKLTKQFIVKKMIFTVDFIYLKFTELSLITPLFPWNPPPPMNKILFQQHNLSGSRKSSICFFQHVSSWRGKGGMGASCLKKRLPESRAFTEFRFCAPTADTAEQTHKLMREGEKKTHFNH